MAFLTTQTVNVSRGRHTWDRIYSLWHSLPWGAGWGMGVMCVLYPYVDNTVRIFIALFLSSLLLSVYIEQHFYFLHCVQNNSFSLTGWRTTYRMSVFLKMFVLFLIFHLLSSLSLFSGGSSSPVMKRAGLFPLWIPLWWSFIKVGSAISFRF